MKSLMVFEDDARNIRRHTQSVQSLHRESLNAPKKTRGLRQRKTKSYSKNIKSNAPISILTVDGESYSREIFRGFPIIARRLHQQKARSRSKKILCRGKNCRQRGMFCEIFWLYLADFQ